MKKTILPIVLLCLGIMLPHFSHAQMAVGIISNSKEKEIIHEKIEAKKPNKNDFEFANDRFNISTEIIKNNESSKNQDIRKVSSQSTILSKSVTISAGELSNALTSTEKTTVTNLTISGTMDARDFLVMRDNMPLLSAIDLQNATISAYTGNLGTDTLGLTKIYAANAIPQYAFYKPTAADGKPLINIELPTSITSIGDYAFKWCRSLTSVTIPASVTSIGDCAFLYYGGLITVDGANSYYSSSAGVLFNKAQTVLIHYPTSKTGSYVIPSSVTSIGDKTFYYCYGLTSVTIPNSVTSIGESAFEGCSNLTSVTIPSSVTSIENWAFRYCSGLTSVTIPASVTSIGDCAFLDCSGLITVDGANSYYSSSVGVLFNKAQTVLIQCPTSKTGSYVIPSSVTSIGESAFEGCSFLTSVTIPTSVTSIGDYAFKYCSDLTSVTIPNSVTSIGDYAFKSCSGLTSVTIPNSVTSIGNWAFCYCSRLTTVTIPASVTSIGNSAFDSCSGLTSIYANSATAVNLSSVSSVFRNVNKTTCTLYVPVGSKTAYQAAVQWKDFSNIVEKTTALEAINDRPVNVSVLNGQLRLSGLQIGENLAVYDTQGRIISSQKMNAENIEIELPARGVYVVRVGGKSMKVIN